MCLADFHLFYNAMLKPSQVMVSILAGINAGLILMLCIISFSGICHAQDDTIRVDTNLVTVRVAVKDRDGRYVTNLKREDFRIFENGTEQEIPYFQPTEQYFTVFLLLDVSDSMTYELQNMIKAANTFFERLRPEDRLIAATFDSRVNTYINNKTVKEIRETRTKAQFFAGPTLPDTMVYDAIDHAMDKMKKIRGRKAVVLYSDGIGSGYRNSAESTLREAEEQEATIYTLRYDTKAPPGYVMGEKEAARRKGRTETAKRYMRELAEVTGGRYFPMEAISNLEEAFSRIAEELSQQYSLAYYPKEPGKKGERREINVKVNIPDAAVQARSSYIVGSTKK